MKTKNYIVKTLLGIFYIAILYFLFVALGHPIADGNNIDILLFSALSALIVNMFLANFFEAPRDVIASSLNVLILLLPFINEPSFPAALYNFLFVYSIICLAFSSLSVVFYNPEGNKYVTLFSEWLKKIAINIGNSKLLFGVLTVSLLINFYKTENVFFYTAVFMYLIVVSSDRIRNIIENTIYYIITLFFRKQYKIPDPIGKMVAVQSKDTFIIDLVDSTKRDRINLFDFVEFRYGALDNTFIRGLVIDRYSLDSQQKIKVLGVSKRQEVKNHGYENNIVYKLDDNKVAEKEKELRECFVGTVVEQSDISKIRFEYSDNKLLTNGDLLYVEAKKKNDETGDIEKSKVLYQVTEAVTDIKKLENRNEIGLIVAKATQLGVWRNEPVRNFENYGWVPAVNTKVLLASDVTGPEIKDGEIELGKIENTEFKVLANVNDLVTHHMAILGTTGTGKSVFAREIIKKLAENQTKVFCIDFTGEMKKKLECADLQLNTYFEATHVNVDGYAFVTGGITVNSSLMDHMSHYVLHKNAKLDKVNVDYLDQLASQIIGHIKDKLIDFINNDEKNICLFELEDLSNTEVSLEYTKFLFMALFDIAKNDGLFSLERKGCIVLEEAHTVIPEWNMVGGGDKMSSKLTNTIAQIALQGRKYNIGLMVIAQRTANVSKTILTQCNTIVSFKQFDNTSRDFLINHFGEEFAKSIPTLKFRSAIVAGKALVSDMPIMFKVPKLPNLDIQEDGVQNVDIPQDPYLEDGAFVGDAEVGQYQGNTDFNP